MSAIKRSMRNPLFPRIAFLTLPLLLAASAVGDDQSLPKEFGGSSPLEWSVRMADSEISRRGDSLAWKEGGRARWDYTAGLFTLSLLKQHPGKDSIAMKRRGCGWSETFLLEVLTGTTS